MLGSMLAVTFILLLIFMSGRFIKYLSQAAVGNISADILFLVMAFRLPGFLELILPLGLFMGILLAYGRMYMESEMTVLHACGYSQNKLLASTWVISGFVALSVGLLTLYVSPAGMAKVEKLFAEQASKTAFELLVPGRFQNLNIGNRITYAGALSDDKQTMFDVFIAESSEDDAERLNILYAEKGVQSVDAETGDRYLVLHNGKQYQGAPGNHDYRELSFDTYGVLIASQSSELRRVKEEAIPTQALIRSESNEYRSILYWRISLVILIPVVTMIAVAVCKVNPRHGRYLHLVPAMLLYILYLGLLILAKKKGGEGDLDPLIAFGVVHIMFICAAIALFYRERLSVLVRDKFGHGGAS
ncbi:MAG: LPS export ABC transporter permease LptF [Oleiphilaceae bacterium]|nr:LPS export ABC transporter permease LptF [Oleiphilaceae bacterium]